MSNLFTCNALADRADTVGVTSGIFLFGFSVSCFLKSFHHTVSDFSVLQIVSTLFFKNGKLYISKNIQGQS